MPVGDLVDHHLDGIVVADIARVKLVGQALDGASGAGDDGGALRGEYGTDPGAYSPDAPSHQNHAAGEAEGDGVG